LKRTLAPSRGFLLFVGLLKPQKNRSGNKNDYPVKKLNK